MRLDKFVAHYLGISRNEVNKRIKSGKVTVDGQAIKQGAYKIDQKQTVYCEETLLKPLASRYFMLNKPEGYVCSTDDPMHSTVLYLIDEPASERLHCAGRLDIDTTGLVLLTDDGQWSHRITSPKHHCFKTYFVTLANPLVDKNVVLFSQGILLRGEKTVTKPATLDIIDDYHAKLTIREGRYHQVKRMFAAIGNHVQGLHRERVGQIELDIEEGHYRPLTEQEINSAWN